MLLSGVDHVIMITNDKTNIVQKSWRYFQDYLSSVGNAFNNLHKVRFAIENMIYHPGKFSFLCSLLNIGMVKNFKSLIHSIEDNTGNPSI